MVLYDTLEIYGENKIGNQRLWMVAITFQNPYQINDTSFHRANDGIFFDTYIHDGGYLQIALVPGKLLSVRDLCHNSVGRNKEKDLGFSKNL